MIDFTKKQREAFETFTDGVITFYWIQKLESGMRSAGFLRADKVGYSDEDVDKVEQFLFALTSGQVSIGEEIQEVRFWVAAYLGECVINRIGGDWIQNPVPDGYQGYPIVDGWIEKGFYFTPFRIVDTTLGSMERGRLLKSIHYVANLKKQRDNDRGVPSVK